MSENRFRKGDWTNCRYDICEIVTDDDEIICVVALNDADKIIGLLEENENLRKQLECNVIHKSVCSICKHHKLEQDTLYPQWHVSRCEKGKEECSKTTVSYCEYFERDNDE